MAYTGGMAAKTLHAVDYLADPDKHAPKPVCAVFGDDAFLRRQAIIKLRHVVLGGDEGDFSLASFEGPKVELRDVLDELSTVAMFGGGTRLVVVEEADEFVSRYRPELEDYVARPARTGVLLLELKSFPGNTRLHKAVAADGLAIDCSAPRAAGLSRWLATWAQQAHRVKLPPSAVEVLLEVIGPELGLLDQELAKLALVVGADKRITPEMVTQLAGGWRAKTVWEMLDAALAGDARGAMIQLDRLLAAGESPIGLLGQISASLRRLAAATRLVLQAQQSGRRISLQAALEQAGVRAFVLKKAERQLRHLGSERGNELYDWLLQADLDLKGASALPARLILERLIVRLAAPRQQVNA
ncbi:MAG: DNA polymerase III subunit delta [Pirellulales bacterium]|nr:DNA polymerase III subunit delta [Pirellulales bacterium]